jgi:hypothetical protein
MYYSCGKELTVAAGHMIKLLIVWEVLISVFLYHCMGMCFGLEMHIWQVSHSDFEEIVYPSQDCSRPAKQ